MRTVVLSIVGALGAFIAFWAFADDPRPKPRLSEAECDALSRRPRDLSKMVSIAIPLDKPVARFNIPDEYVTGVLPTGFFVDVMVDDFRPEAYIAEAPGCNDYANYWGMSIGGSVFERAPDQREAALRWAGASSAALESLLRKTPNRRVHGLKEFLDYTSGGTPGPRDVYLGLAGEFGSDPVVIKCTPEGSARAPHCRDVFFLAGIVVEISYRREHLANWRSLRRQTEEFIVRHAEN